MITKVLTLSIQTGHLDDDPRFTDITPQEAIDHLLRHPDHWATCEVSTRLHLSGRFSPPAACESALTSRHAVLTGDSDLVSLLLSRIQGA